jgi:NAD(P)-dependent dehydrogenase (short-subunit alcohol dehydrogenase family)
MYANGKGRPGRTGDAVIVTGSSTGLGLETALHLAGAGFRVYATLRELAHRDEVLAAAKQRGVELRVVHLDLTDRASIEHAVETVVGECGGVFGLVNNGGIGLRGSVEDCSEDEVRQVFEANVFGTIAVTRAVLPHMRSANSGRVITVSSIGGRVCGFGVAVYCASKFAEEGLAEGLALELAPFGIQSVLVEPGMIKTDRWSGHRGTAQQAMDSDSPYYQRFWASEAIADRIVERSRTRPADVADAIHQALTADRPRMRYVVGRGASAVVLLRRYLPETLFERLYFGGHLRRLDRRVRTPQSPPLTVTQR